MWHIPRIHLFHTVRPILQYGKRFYTSLPNSKLTGNILKRLNNMSERHQTLVQSLQHVNRRVLYVDYN
jgi:hypothetical protein